MLSARAILMVRDEAADAAKRQALRFAIFQAADPCARIEKYI
jgi:hypothetical protein